MPLEYVSRFQNLVSRRIGPSEEMEVEEEAVDTAAMTPLGDADYVLALEWDGTYLG